MAKISVVIPSVDDPALQKTVDDLHQKSVNDLEIIVVFDGKEPHPVEGAKVAGSKEWKGMRWAVNEGMSLATGEYLIKTDDHCMFGEKFDEILLKDIKDNWVVHPRRLWLDPVKWELFDSGRLPADYERLLISQPEKIGGCRWDSRTAKRKHVMVDETMIFQGSFYMMHRKHWDWLGGLQEEGYGHFAQEAAEICLKTWLGGGKVMVNKNTWYAHKHRSFGRLSRVTGKDMTEGNAYSRDYWLNNRWEERVHDIGWLMKRFGLNEK